MILVKPGQRAKVSKLEKECIAYTWRRRAHLLVLCSPATSCAEGVGRQAAHTHSGTEGQGTATASHQQLSSQWLSPLLHVSAAFKPQAVISSMLCTSVRPDRMGSAVLEVGTKHINASDGIYCFLYQGAVLCTSRHDMGVFSERAFLLQQSESAYHVG